MKDIHELAQLAIRKFGQCNQLVKAIEELSELSQAICKDITSPPSDLCAGDHVREEIADVKIMIAQLEIMYGIEECQNWLEIKKEKLIGRI